MEGSLAMLRTAADNRIGTIICTPHYKEGKTETPPEKIDGLIHALEARMADEGLNIKLCGGTELFFTETALAALEKGQAKTLAASDFVLAEFVPWVTWEALQEGLFSLKGSGYRPILAHAERYECLIKGREERNRVHILRDYDILIQINAEAVMEKGKFTKYLLKNELADFVATDAHSNRRRGPYLLACGAYLSKKYGMEYAGRLLYGNARDILANIGRA
jgi:protein-tyrosine phosphatase